MSPWLEFEGKNVEMAIKKACHELNIPKEKLKYDVVSYGSTGIFGLVGTKKARIKVAAPAPISEPVLEVPDTAKQYDRFDVQIQEDVGSQIETTDAEREIHTLADDSKELGRNALQRIIDLITTDANISIEESSGRILFNVQGGNSAILIGKRGQTLEAIQYLVEKIVNKNREKRVRIQVDVEGYIEKRRISLQRLALRLAEKVKRTGKPASAGQMNAHDRRIVHITLKEDRKVRTQSMGDGFLRKLVIFPKKNASQKRRSD
jgi:spoIIIJ-associated protein